MSEDFAVQDYQIDLYKDKFIGLLAGVEREGIDDLINWIKYDTDFFTAPASTRYHGNYKGGLVQHSIDVYEHLVSLADFYELPAMYEDSIVIVALLHDLCKANMYGTEKRNRKNEDGVWEQYDFYTHDEQLNFGGHGSKSLYLAMKFIQLTDDEAVAINCHMSSWDGNKYVGNAFSQFKLAWLLHVADEAATYLEAR